MANYNPEDKITVDVPLFIRLLEYAREDAKSDMDLHKVTENILKLLLVLLLFGVFYFI